MLVAATVLFATLSFVLYRSSPSTWLISSRLKQLLPKSKSCNQIQKDSFVTSANSDAFETQVSIRGSVKEELPKGNGGTNTKSRSTAPKQIPPPVLVQFSDEIVAKDDSASENDDGHTYKPSYPAHNSTQRASQPHKGLRQPWFTERNAQLMPPPLAPPQAPRIVNNPSAAAINRTPQLVSSAQQARTADAIVPTRNLSSKTTISTKTSSNSNSSSDSLMPPPLARPSQQTRSANTTSKPTNPRQKVILQPGHSPLDWANLSRSGQNLSGVSTLQRVRPSTLKSKNGRKGRPAWSSYHGKVYNITPFLPYHPGGEGELMRAAGKDGGKLFMDAHAWVSWENMLEDCLVGILVSENDGAGTDTVGDRGGLNSEDVGLDDID